MRKVVLKIRRPKMIDAQLVHMEEIRQMQIHRWIESEKAQTDLGEAPYFDWVKKYAKIYRDWVMTVPDHCINCGLCKGSNKCHQPLHEKRIKFIYSRPDQ